MGVSLSTFSDGTAISASDLRARVGTIEDFVNEGIVQGDYDSTAWTDTNHFYGPDFLYPNRMRFISSDISWRRTPGGHRNRSFHHHYSHAGAYVPVTGLGATFRVDADSTPLIVTASFYAWEIGGDLNAAADIENASYEAANFQLFVNGTAETETHRAIFASVGTAGLYYLVGRKQLAMVWAGTVNKGVNHVQVKVKVNTPSTGGGSGGGNDWKHVYVEARSINVEALLR
jgi:hypothetical protein